MEWKAVEMKLPVVIFLVTTLGILRGSDAGSGILDGATSICDKDVTDDYLRAIYDFNTRLYKQMANDHSNHFVMSPKSIWMTVAAIAEDAEGEARQKLFKALNLPEEQCLRDKYYHLALISEPTGFNVTLERRAAIYFDEALEVNPEWEQFVRSQGFLDIKTAPIKRESQKVVEELRQYISAEIPEPDLSGNSILLDSLYYEALWTFSDSSVYKSQFYNDFGEEMGTVEFLKIKKHVNLIYLPLLNAKFLSMPVGIDNRYVMIYGIAVGTNKITSTVELFSNNFMIEIIKGLKESLVPFEVAIPCVTMSSEVDVRQLLEKIGISNLWSDPAATSTISEPAALPSAYVQRITAKLDSTSVDPPVTEPTELISDLTNSATGLEAAIGQDFIANRPFMYALFDTKTYTCLVDGLYYGPK